MADNIDAIVGEDTAEDKATMDEMQRDEQTEETTEEPVAGPVEVKEETKEKEPQTVPYGVLREERDKRQALEDQIAQQTAQIGRMENTFQQVLNRAQETVDPKVETPDFDLDPDAFTRHKLEGIEKRLDDDAQDRKTQQDGQAKEQKAKQFLDMYSNAAREFSNDTPDAGEAYKFALETMDSELKLRGVIDSAERSRILEREEEQIVARAFQQGVNPAKRIYELAVARGYKAKQTDEDKLERLAKTEDANNSLSGTGGDGGSAPVTLARLAELDGDDFDKAFEKARSSGALG